MPIFAISYLFATKSNFSFWCLSHHRKLILKIWTKSATPCQLRLKLHSSVLVFHYSIKPNTECFFIFFLLGFYYISYVFYVLSSVPGSFYPPPLSSSLFESLVLRHGHRETQFVQTTQHNFRITAKQLFGLILLSRKNRILVNFINFFRFCSKISFASLNWALNDDVLNQRWALTTTKNCCL